MKRRRSTSTDVLTQDHWRQWWWNVLFDEVMTHRRVQYAWLKSGKT